MGRRQKKIPDPTFHEASKHIDTLEVAACSAHVDADFTVDYFLRWLYPDETIDKLRAAFPYIRELDQTSHHNVSINLPLTPAAVNCTFQVACKDHQVLVPNPKLARSDGERFAPIYAAVSALHEQHQKFEKVRAVVCWLNENATPGAARHYCPWLAGLLPPDHAFNQASGTIYREPTASMNKVIPLMRECGSIVASALLLGEQAPTGDKIAMNFRGVRRADTLASEYTSQMLRLL